MSRRKVRLDVLLVDKGIAKSRARAQAMIMARAVRLPNASFAALKAGTRVDPDEVILTQEDPNPYVSRGGMKLESALDAFEFDPTGLIAIDVGASTGGFTDCLLQRGAKRVYAVDVGYGQLDWKLRSDERVVVLERTNARYLTDEQIPEKAQLVVMDASFISLAKIAPALLPLLAPGAEILAMIKPQFEAEPSEVPRGGVIKDEQLRQTVIDRAIVRLTDLGLSEAARADSAIHGPKGNIECFVRLTTGK